MLKMIKNEGIEEYSEYLKSISSDIKKTDVCYGKQALILFYLYKYKTYSLQKDYDYYNTLIEDCINDLAEGNDIIAIIEFLYVHLLYKKDFGAEYDLSEIVQQFEEIVYSHFIGCINNENLDGYFGAGYPMRYFLLKEELPKGLVEYFKAYIKKNVIKQNNGVSYVKLTEESSDNDLGITHGLSFIITTYINLHQLNCLSPDDMVVLKEFIEYTKLSYKDYLIKEKAHNIAYGKLGLLYSLIHYNTFFYDKEIEDIIEEIFIFLSKNKDMIYQNNNNSLLYGNTGIVLFYKIISNKISNRFQEDKEFWDNKMLNIINSDSTEDTLAEGKLGHYLASMSMMLNNYNFMNLFFINTI